MQLGTSGPRGKGVKRSTARSRSHEAEICHENSFQLYPTNFHRTRQAYITINAHRVTTTWIQRSKVKGHTKAEVRSDGVVILDLEYFLVYTCNKAKTVGLGSQ